MGSLVKLDRIIIADYHSYFKVIMTTPYLNYLLFDDVFSEILITELEISTCLNFIEGVSQIESFNYFSLPFLF